MGKRKRWGGIPLAGKRAAREAAQQPQIQYECSDWTPEDDERLSSLVAEKGPGHWAELAEALGGRNPNDCWTRWYFDSLRLCLTLTLTPFGGIRK